MDRFQRLINVYKAATLSYTPTAGDIKLAVAMLNGSINNHLQSSETAPLAGMYGVEKEASVGADWLPAQHKALAVIVRNFYTKPLNEYEDYILLRKTARVGLYQKNSSFLLVLRGTVDGGDIIDDLTIAGYSARPITLVKEGRTMLNSIDKPTKNIIITGHSLGGYASQILAEEYDVGCVAFNPAAPSLKPPKIGSGVNKSYVYHIVGDLVSTHTDPNKNTIFRIDTGLKYDNTLKAHKMDSFLMGSPAPRAYLTAQQEDLIYNIFTSTGAAAGSAFFGNLNVPIPGSLREVDPKKQLIGKFDDNVDSVVATVGNPIMKILSTIPSTPNSTLAYIQESYNNILPWVSKVGVQTKETSATKLKMSNDIFGLVTVAQLPQDVLAKNSYNFYSAYSKVNADAPLGLQSFTNELITPSPDLAKETNIEMLDIDPEVGTNMIVDMVKNAKEPTSQRLQQLQAIAANYDTYGTFNREEILEKRRTSKTQLPPWKKIPILEGQIDVNIY